MSLRLIRVLDVDPDRGHRLLEVHRLVGRAQDSADAGRYQASITTLSAALSTIQASDNDELLQPLLPKVYGLLGFDEHKLGHPAQAREHIALALRESEAMGDADGVRVYSAGLETIDGT
jgi:hypothetical protein